MIKKGLINFLKCLKFYFPILGVFSLGLLIGVAVFINIARNNIYDLLNVVENVTSDSQTLNVGAFKETIIDSLKKLPWNSNFIEAITKLFSTGMLKETLMEAIKQVVGEQVFIDSGLESTVSSTADAFTNAFIAFSIFLIIGLLASFFYSKMLCTKTLRMKLEFKKIILLQIVNYILTLTLVVSSTYLLSKMHVIAIVTSLVTLILNQAISLIEAFICRTDKRMKFKNVFKFKTILELAVVTIILTIVVFGFEMLLGILINPSISFIICIPMIYIYLSVINLNAFSYIKDYYEDKRLAKN